MKDIIPAIAKEELEKELNEKTFVRKTNKGSNEIYSFTHKTAPNLMKEVGRLREITFRNAGGGTGKETDIDSFDIAEKPYHQLIVWDPKSKEIIGGYRYIKGSETTTDENGKFLLATSNLFNFSDKFLTEYLSSTIELGRSFVQPDYQSILKGRKSLYALDNLWDGLGALIVENPNIKYFFGKVTMYPSFNKEARNAILFFLKKYFNDKENLIKPIFPLKTESDNDALASLFNSINYKDNYKALSKKVRNLGENIPPLINAYINLSTTMRTFGTAINGKFGNVEETAIMINIEDINDNKRERHIYTYLNFLKLHFPKRKLNFLKKK